MKKNKDKFSNFDRFDRDSVWHYKKIKSLNLEYDCLLHQYAYFIKGKICSSELYYRSLMLNSGEIDIEVDEELKDLGIVSVKFIGEDLCKLEITYSNKVLTTSYIRLYEYFYKYKGVESNGGMGVTQKYVGVEEPIDNCIYETYVLLGRPDCVIFDAHTKIELQELKHIVLEKDERYIYNNRASVLTNDKLCVVTTGDWGLLSYDVTFWDIRNKDVIYHVVLNTYRNEDILFNILDILPGNGVAGDLYIIIEGGFKFDIKTKLLLKLMLAKLENMHIYVKLLN